MIQVNPKETYWSAVWTTRLLIVAFTLTSVGCAKLKGAFRMPDLSRVEIASPNDIEVKKLRLASPYPHPFALKVTVTQGTSGNTDDRGGRPLPMLINPDNLPEIERYFVDALWKYEAATVIGVDLDEFDAELVISLQYDLSGSVLGTRERSGWLGTLNTGLWLFLGVPAWVVADTAFSPPARVTYSLNRKPDPAAGKFNQLVFNNNPGVDVANVGLSFSERNKGWDYLTQIVVPPTLVPPDRAKTDYNLGIKLMERSAREIAVAVKLRVNDGHLVLAESVPYLHQIRDGEVLHLFLFSNSLVESSSLQWEDGGGAAREFLGQDQILTSKFESQLYEYLNTVTLPVTARADGTSTDDIFKVTVVLETAQSVPWTWTVSSGEPVRSASLLATGS